jgi:hypothetical protein
MSSQPTTTIKGHHGTNQALVDKIKSENFECSQKSEWLGRGAYFFADGISAQGPEEDAIKWADLCVKIFGNTYRYWAVMTAEINTDKMLDLTDEGQLKIFNKMRDIVNRRFNFRNRSNDGRTERDYLIDIEILDEIKKETEILAAKSHFFIKFTVENQRNISSRVPNVTVVCVYEPEKAIDKDTIKNPRSGMIK